MRHNIGHLDKKELLISLGILVLALSVRLFYLYESSANPSFTVPTVDSKTYDDLARLVAKGRGMNYEFFWQSFFYPVFLSVIYLAGKSSVICAKVVQLLLGCVTCLLTYRLGKRIFDRRTGVIAGIMTALYGPLIFFESELLPTGWAAFWSVVLIFLFIKTLSKKKVWLCLILGICGALSIITRPTFLPFFAAAIVWLAISFHRAHDAWRKLTLRLGAVLVGFVLIAISVAAQNFRVTRHFGFLPVAGGINFYIGNNPNYDETIIARPGYGWKEILDLPRRSGVIGDQWDDQKFYKQKVVNYLCTEPLAFGRGLAYKAIQFLSSREIPRNVDVYLFGKWSRLLSLLTWKVRGFGFPFGVLLPLALLGVASYWRQVPIPLLLFIILYPLAIILVFVAARYRVSVIPVTSIMAAVGLLNLIRMVRGLYWGRLAIIFVFAVGIILLSTLPGPFPEEKCNLEAELYYNVAIAENRQDKNREAVKHFLKAVTLFAKTVQLNPDSASAHYDLARALKNSGRTDEAIARLKETLRLRPDWVSPMNSLAWLLVTHKDTKFRNPEEAIMLAERACELTNYQDAGFVDTLAAAYAAVGRFSDAVATAEKAVKLVLLTGDKERIVNFQNRLQFYRAGQPYGQQPPAAQE